MSKVTWQ